MARSLIPNSTQIPDVILDRWMSHLTGAELKVLLYVARRTYGFGKGSDRISLQQIARGIRRRNGSALDLGTGLSVSSVARSAKSLEERGLLLRQQNRDESTGEHDETMYSLNLECEAPSVEAQTASPVEAVAADGAGEGVLPKSEDVLSETGGGTPILGVGVLPKSEIQETEQETDQETAAGTAAGLSDLIAELVSRDMNREDAVRLAQAKPDECRRQLAYLPYKAGELRGSPGAWLRCAIEGEYGPPAGYRRARESAEQRERAEQARSVQVARAIHERTHRAAYLTYVDGVATRLPETHPALSREFEESEARVRAACKTAPISAAGVERCLASLTLPEHRLERLLSFLTPHGLVLGFWQWDRALNHERYGAHLQLLRGDDTDP